MDRQLLASIVQEGGRLLTRLLQTYSARQMAAPVPSVELPAVKAESRGVSTEQTIAYQRRELAKELVLLEGHLQQGCKIGGEACDCCEKHPLKIEGLAQETAGMTRDPIYTRLAEWTKEITPIITEEAAASGEYNDRYPALAMQAREFRKTIMPEISTQEVPDGNEETE